MRVSPPDLHLSPPITLRRIRDRHPWLAVGAGALAVLLGVLAAVDRGRLLVWDRPITHAVIELRSPSVNRVARWVSRLGSTPVVLATGAAGVALAVAATWGFVPAIAGLYVKRQWVWWTPTGMTCGVLVLVAWCRVWLGVHWASDVVGSLAVAFVALSVAEAAIDGQHQRPDV